MEKVVKKIFALAILAVAGLTACDAPNIQPPAPPPTKKIVDKISSVESRFSGAAFVFSKGSSFRPTTVYYLVAEDGSVCEVGLTQYAQTKVGTVSACPCWETK
jgi:hypothetical protein